MSKGGRKEREPLHLSNKTSYEYASHSALHSVVGFFGFVFFLVSNNSKSSAGAVGMACREGRVEKDTLEGSAWSTSLLHNSMKYSIN